VFAFFIRLHSSKALHFKGQFRFPTEMFEQSFRNIDDILKCHPNTLLQWDNKGIFVAVRFGERKDRRYRKDDILRFIKKAK